MSDRGNGIVDAESVKNGSTGMGSGTWTLIVSVVVLIIALVCCFRLMNRLVDKLGDGIVAAHATGLCEKADTNRVASLQAVVPTRVPDNEERMVDCQKALEILRAEQTSWLTVIGFFSVIFGLIVPIGSYLLQRQSLKDERENLMESVDRKHAEVKNEIDSLKKKANEYHTINEAKSAPFWKVIARTYECFLAKDFEPVSADQRVANLILGLEHCLDSYVRANDKMSIRWIYEDYHAVIKIHQAMHKGDWSKAATLLQTHPEQLLNAVEWNDYEDLLMDEPSVFNWVKSFYSSFLPSKVLSSV